MREAVATGLSTEGKERAEKVIAALERGLSPDRLRERRAVVVPEWTGRPAAETHLGQLAGGDPAAGLTADAKSALRRRTEAAGSATLD